MAQRQHAIDLTRTLENVNIPSFVADRRARVVWANKAAKTAFGDVIGKATTTFVAPDDVPFVERQIERKLRGAPGTDYEVEVLTADGRRRPAEVSSVPIREGGLSRASSESSWRGRRPSALRPPASLSARRRCSASWATASRPRTSPGRCI
jgi:PAS domain S-box-containing protein